MRLLYVLATLSAIAAVPLASAAHWTCATPGAICVTGTLLGWDKTEVQAKVGDVVVWRSGDGFPHPVALVGASVGGGLDQPHQSTGSQSSWQVSHEGTILFACKNHPWMTGRIVATS